MISGPIRSYVIMPHAAFQMGRRGINEETVNEVLEAPEQRITLRAGRDVLQSRKVLGGRPLPGSGFCRYGS